MRTPAARSLTFLYFGVNPWTSIKQRAQHIAETLSESNRVIYVNPVKSDPFHLLLTRRPQNRVWPLMKTQIHPQRPGLDVVSLPSLFPGSKMISALSDAHNTLVISHLLETLRACSLNPEVFWFSHPAQAAMIRLVPETSLCVYDCMDDYRLTTSTEPVSRIVTNERFILQRADLVFATSKHLEEKCRTWAREVIRMPNGADIDHFKTASSMILHGNTTEKITVGFYGHLGLWIDYGLLADIARMRPSWKFIIVGPGTPFNLEPLLHLKNVEVRGEAPYTSLPKIISEFDVCIMPFLVNEFTKSINPVKMYEYLSSGKPIVSTDLPEVRELFPLLRIGHDAIEFIQEIEASLREEHPQDQNERIRFARENSWEKRAAAIEKEIQRHLDNRG